MKPVLEEVREPQEMRLSFGISNLERYALLAGIDAAPLLNRAQHRKADELHMALLGDWDWIRMMKTHAIPDPEAEFRIDLPVVDFATLRNIEEAALNHGNLAGRIGRPISRVCERLEDLLKGDPPC